MPGADWTELARKSEDLGYSTLTLPDHFDGQMAPTPALAAAAAVTTTLRVGTLVYGNDYRHPVVLASEMATLDQLSNGRLEVGLGAGWMTTDYEAAGIPLDRPGVRIERMLESLTVIRGLFGEGPFSFSGDHYTITGLDLQPKPLQAPHPPILIGGGGPRMLRIAGREADIVGVNANLRSGAFDAASVSDATAENIAQKIEWVREGAGERFDDIELHARVHFVVFCDDRQATADGLAPMFGLTGDQALASPLALFGDPASMIADLVARREEFGFSYITVGAAEIDQFAPVVAELAGT